MNHTDHDPMTAIIDMRGLPIRSRKDIASYFEEAYWDISQHGKPKIGFICISEEQNRWLALERYEQYHDAAEAKAFRLERFRKYPVHIYESDDGLPCPGCHQLH